MLLVGVFCHRINGLWVLSRLSYSFVVLLWANKRTLSLCLFVSYGLPSLPIHSFIFIHSFLPLRPLQVIIVFYFTVTNLPALSTSLLLTGHSFLTSMFPTGYSCPLFLRFLQVIHVSLALGFS